MSILIIFAVLFIVLLTIGVLFEILSMQWSKRRYKTPRGKLVDVDGHQLHIHVMGERQANQSVVVLEAGVASNSLDWQKVQPKIAEFAQVVIYDRAGYGWSEKGKDPRSPQQIVTELHTLLQNAVIEAPYLMVGHSFGGIYVRLFAETYPDEVAGLVLVESSVPSMIKAVNTAPEISRLKRVSRMKRIGLVRLMLARILTHSAHLEGEAKKEYLAMNMLDSDNVIREAVPMYEGITLSDRIDLPLIIISREPFEELPSEKRWQDYQQELVELSSTSRHIYTTSGSHYPALSEPDVVVRAVQDMLGQISYKHKESQ
ncbi:MAG: alpha/beta hydrolase [Anaerolineae bacterium]|nr:alpha/beta hydrolase [Anaerolineae bacterium]MDQ7035723.1 alpha/beta hydrolase [Anaerolineae bacterium]